MLMFSIACEDPVTMEPGAAVFGSAARPLSEYLYCVTNYDVQSPYHTVYYVPHPGYAYQQPEDIVEVTAYSAPGLGSPMSEYWQFGARMCHNNELLLDFEVVSIVLYCYTPELKSRR
jgi:hypothetical protein